MATLIWNKVRNIRIGDATVPFEVKYDDGSSLVADSNSAGYALAQAVNGEAGIELCLHRIGWCLNRGQPNYDWASFWQIASSSSPNDIKYEGSGNIGYFQDWNSTGIRKAGFGYALPAMSYFNPDEYIIISGTTHGLLQPYWNIENESVYVDIPIPTKSGNDWVVQDSNGVWQLKVRQYSNDSGYNSLHSDLGDLGNYHESATWYDDNLNGDVTIPFEDITNEVLYGLKLKLIRDRNSIIDIINGTSLSSSSDTSYVPMSIVQEAPDFDFSVNITSINNLPSSVLDGGSAEGTFSITSNQFNGLVSVFVLNSQEDIDNINNSLLTNFGEDDAVNYGEITLDSSSYSIASGETIEVSVTYTADGLNANQDDSYTIIIVPSSIDASAYGEYSSEAQTQFENLTSSDLMSFSDVPSISIINVDIGEPADAVVEDYTPSSVLINKPSDIIFHILEKELGYNKGIGFESIIQSRIEHNNWNLGFSVTKEIDSKKLIQEISKSSKLIPTLSNDELRFVDIRTTYRGGSQYHDQDSGIVENVSVINSKDVIKYNFSRTKIEDVITKIELQYDYDYGTKKYKSKKTISVDESTYWLTSNWGAYIADNSIVNSSYTNYYGFKTNGSLESESRKLDHSLTTKEIKNKYLSANYPEAVEQFLEYNLMWGMNQHNIVSMTLPLKYYNLEVGDLIEFDEMILGNKIYGEKYVLDNDNDMPVRCGQFILPLFIITETNKSFNKLEIKAVQLHHLSYSSLQYKEKVYAMLTAPDTSFGTILGDINGDSLVDVLDLVSLINIIISESTEDLTPQEFLIADYNQDGAIDVLDVVSMIQDIIN